MIINLKENLLDFIKSHNLSLEAIEFISYKSSDDGEIYHCDLIDFIEVADEIDFEEHDPLIKHREVLSDTINVVADEWFIQRSQEPGAIWQLNHFPETGEYEVVREEDLISPDDNIDSEVVELLDLPSPNATYALDSISIGADTYQIETKDGIQRVVTVNGLRGVIIACNPKGRYWTQPHAGVKDPQMLFHPELVKIIMEYQATLESVKRYNLRDADIGSVFNLEELASKYNLNIEGFEQDAFNNLDVVFVRPDAEYQITFTGAASFPDLRHEIITRMAPNDIIKL